MGHSNTIAAVLFLAFVVFITMRGELRQYLQVLGLQSGGTNAAASTATGSTVTGTTPGLGQTTTLGTGNETLNQQIGF